MILYFSGTGNSKYVAGRIKDGIGDAATDLFDRLKSDDHSTLHSERPWVIVTPTYAWRLPKFIDEYLRKTELAGNKKIYFILTCGDGIGNAQKYLKELCEYKNLTYCGCFGVVMPENYIAMFNTPTKEQALVTVQKAEPVIDDAIQIIKAEKDFPDLKINAADKIKSGAVNNFFYKAYVKDDAFYVTDDCVLCLKCVNVCVRSNIVIKDGRPVWGGNCTHCMACICRCPKQAIEYGKKSVGQPRYVFPKNK